MVTETVPRDDPGVNGGDRVELSGTAANNCTRTDPLSGGSSYQPITVTVNVAANAALPLTNQVSVSGGGSATASASDSTSLVAVPSYLISTLAGGTLPPTAMPGTQAAIGSVTSVAPDAAGNIYLSSESSMVYKLDTNGTLTRIAGTGQPGFSGDGGPAVSAQLNVPAGLAVDGTGNLYIADAGTPGSAWSRPTEPSTPSLVTASKGIQETAASHQRAGRPVRRGGGCVRQPVHRRQI